MPGSSDARCAALCTDELPEHEGAYDVCSSESLAQCVGLCQTRIQGTENLCAECLLEDAEFFTPSGGEAFDVCGDDGTCYVGLYRFCHGGTWTYAGGGGGGGNGTASASATASDTAGEDPGDSCDGAEVEYEEQVASGTACSYDSGDDAAQAACHAALHPRDEVSCDVEFGPVAECAGLCTGG